MLKQKLSAKEILRDIRNGFSDSELMETYHISENSLKATFRKLMAVGALKQSELDLRRAIFDKTKGPQEEVPEPFREAQNQPPGSKENIPHTNEDTLIEPPLIAAVRSGKLSQVVRLVRRGGNLEVTDNDGATPLIVAAKEGKENIFGYLLDSGADLKATDSSGMHALSWASTNEHSAIVDLILGDQLNPAGKTQSQPTDFADESKCKEEWEPQTQEQQSQRDLAREAMNKDRKSIQGAVLWAVAPGLIFLIYFIKMISGLFGDRYVRDDYLFYEFKGDVFMLVVFGIIALVLFAIVHLRSGAAKDGGHHKT